MIVVKSAETWTERAVVMRRILGCMAGILIERVGDTRHDNGTEHSSPEETGYPLAQRRIDGIGDYMAAAGSVLLHWTRC